jgi:hypothetical protein
VAAAFRAPARAHRPRRWNAWWRDLRRLETEAERLLSDATVLARGQRLMAVRMDYDLVLMDAARALDVGLPHERAPFTSEERFRVSIDLTASGLVW